MTSVYSLILAGVVGFVPPPLKSSTLDSQQLEEAEFVLRGMADSRDRLISGACRIKGTNRTVFENEDASAQATEEVDCHCVFDYSKGLYRFDRNQSPEDGMTMGGKFIRTDAHSYSMLDTVGGEAVMRDGPDAEADSTIAPFDIRCLGLFNLVGPYWEVTPEIVFNAMCENELVEFTSEDDRLYQLTWKPGEHEKTSLWLDADKGYSWVRYEWTYDSPTYAAETVIETGWDSLNDVWVPTSVRIHDKQTPDEAKESEWTIDWESVNDAVAEKSFEPTAFVEEDTIPLYDESLGEPVFVGLVGQNSVMLNDRDDDSSSLPMRLLLAGATIVILCAAGFFMMKRSQSNKKTADPTGSHPATPSRNQ